MLLLGRHITFLCSFRPVLVVPPLDLLFLIQFAFSLIFVKTAFYLTSANLFFLIVPWPVILYAF